MAESSIYPNAIDGYSQIPLVVDNVTRVNAVTVNRLRCAIINIENELGVLPSSTNYATVRARLDALESGSEADLTDLENRVTVLEGDVLSLETELGSNPSGAFVTVEARLDAIEAASTAPLTLVTDDALIFGDLLIINSSGNAELADSNTGIVDEARTIGSSTAAYLIGETAEINSVPGKLIPARFLVAPIAADNGKPVYLSGTPGVATLTPPTATSSIVFLLGILQSADGALTTPNILFQPNLIGAN